MDSLDKGCLESASVSVLVNGNPTKEFLLLGKTGNFPTKTEP